MVRCFRKAESGQALVETAIIMPIMVFTVLGALQIMLIEHGKIMTEYAAYNAARAGIVHNGNWNVMRNAALISALPLYKRTDSVLQFGLAWAEVKAVAEITEAVDTGTATLERLGGDLLGVELPGIAQDVSLIEVEVDSPTQAAYEAWSTWVTEQEEHAERIDARGELLYPPGSSEIDFDDTEFYKWAAQSDPTIQPGRLGVDVRILYPLKIPIINKIIFELWLAQLLLNTREVRSDLTEWAQWKARVGGSGAHSGQYLEDAVREAPDEGPLDDFFTTRQWTKEIRTLRWIAEHYGVYLIPLHGTYAMQMQSSSFESNRREPVWFTVEDF
jgi:hypothetical protein